MSLKRSNAWAEIALDDFDSAFHLLLGRLVHAIARLDFNVGLQLGYWAHKDDASILKLLKLGTSKLHERLIALEERVSDAWATSQEKGREEFRLWFDRAHKARGLRNEYAHGRWAAPGKHVFSASGRLSDATPLLVFVPLDWGTSENWKDNAIELTIEDFAAQVEEAEQLSEQFWDIVTKYGQHLHPGRSLPAS